MRPGFVRRLQQRGALGAACLAVLTGGYASLAHRACLPDIGPPFAQRPRALFPVGSYGHTGFTGCILWIDPGSRTFYVLLSNRVYPDGGANILELYNALGTLAARAARPGAGEN